ncbi:hypothetical protein N9L64_03165 [Flavobacteriaceae bacterium]|nr:hypothetical protein [Flavobacteriaceae bacterium]
MKHLILAMLLLVPILSSGQSRQEKRLAKRIEKMSTPKWLKISGNNASFVDNKNSYIASNSFDDRMQNNGRMNNNGRKNLVYDNVGVNRNSSLDYSRIESRLIQISLFLPEIKEVEVQIEINCDGTYKDVQYLVIANEDLKALRRMNTREDFLRDTRVTDPTVFRKIEMIHATLCS